MQLISKYDKEFCDLLRVAFQLSFDFLFHLYDFSKYLCTTPLKDNKGIIITKPNRKVVKDIICKLHIGR